MATIGNSLAPYFTATTSDVFSANGTGTTFTLTRSISNLVDIEVLVNNIQQNPFNGAYSVNGTTLTFSEAPSAGANNVLVSYRQAVISSSIPTPNTVASISLQRDLTLGGNTTSNGTMFTQALVPTANVTYDIGTSTLRYKDIYLSGTTIKLGDVSLSASGNTFTVANSTGGTLPSSMGNTTIAGTANVTGDMTIGGNLTVTGTMTYINTTDVNIGDAIISLNADLAANVAPTEDAGISINRGASTNAQFKWIESTDNWSLGNTTVSGMLNANDTIITGTANVSVGINVGANVNLGTTYMDVGNSTVNTTITNVTVSTNTVNVASTINVGANVNLSTSQIYIGNSTVNTVISATALTTTSNTVSLGTAAYVLANGNVGVGTSSPSAKLESASDGSTLNALYLTDTRAFSATPKSVLGFNFKYDSAGANTVGSLIQGGKENSSNNNYAGMMSFWTRTNGGDLTQRAVIDSNGNLGIGTGTNSLVSRLNISDGAAMYAAGTGEMIQLRRTPANGNNTTSFVGINFGNASNSFRIGYGGATDRFRFIDGGDVEILSLVNGGSVGIGLTNPSYKLDVNGTINATGIQTSGTPSLTFSASKWMVQQETADQSLMYYCGANSSTYGTHYLYRATSTGTPLITMTYAANGNIGIGTTSPTHKLEIYGGDNTNSFRLFGNSAAGPSVKIEYTGANGRAWNIISNSIANAGGAGALQIWNSTDGVTAMVIAPRGDVGVGSDSPYNSAWGADSHQLSIGGTRGFGVVTLNNTARIFSMGAGAGYHYMSYDSTAAAHNLIINQYGVVALRGGAYTTATGVGIAFPPTQVASSDLNTLDDYEEGEINANNLGLAYATPGTSSFTYSDRRGTYTKIGRVVYFTTDIRVQSFSKGTASGILSVIGLPFAQRNTAGYDNARCTVQLYNWTYTTSPIIASVASAGTNIMLTRMVSGGITVDIDDPSASSIVWVTGFYFV
jgi:hypothetical protein